MKRYESYSTSSLPWIDSIPSTWSICRAKFMYKKESRDTCESDGVVTCFRDGTVTLRSKRRTTGFTEAIQEIGYQGIRKGDLVIHVMDAFAGAVGVSDSDGKGTPVYSVCTAIGDYNNYYYAHVIRMMARTGYIQSLYRGIRERSSDFRFEVFARQYLPIPPRAEQDQIVRYLDWQVSRINKLIAAKKMQIALLKERKESVISQVIMRGLNDSDFVQSGIYWLPIMPANWHATKLRYVIAKMRREIVPDSELLVCSNSGDVKARGDSKLGLVAASNDIYQGVVVGDLLIHGMDTWHGAIGISSMDGMCTPVVHVCQCKIEKRFVAYYLKMMAYTKVFKAISNGVRQNTSDFRSWDKVGELLIAFPDIDEQIRISDYIDNELTVCNAGIEEFDKQITVLHDLRTRLISDVVTGQIDVRGIDIPEYEPVVEEPDETPDESEETDALQGEEV